jgi:hypothetical protein
MATLRKFRSPRQAPEKTKTVSGSSLASAAEFYSTFESIIVAVKLKRSIG